jgi:predicted permease
VAAATAAAVIIWSVAELAGMHLRQPGFGSKSAITLNVAIVIVVTAVVSLAGWALLAILEHRTARARAIWTAVAVVVTLLSLGGPFSGHGVSTGNRLVLGLIHLTVATVVITGLRRTSGTAR